MELGRVGMSVRLLGFDLQGRGHEAIPEWLYFEGIEHHLAQKGPGSLDIFS